MIRPTSDRAREALFNILGFQVLEARVLDLYAGTGALGLEALSRGAKTALFVDNNPKAIALIQRNGEVCGFSGQLQVLKRDVGRGLSFLPGLAPGSGFNLIFIDPPYGKGQGERALQNLTALGVVADNAVAVVEDNARENLPERIGCLRLIDQRRYGENGFWLYQMSEEE